MATHRTRPNVVQDVTAVPIGAGLARATGLREGDYIVTTAAGEQYVTPQAEFEAQYEAIPTPSIDPAPSPVTIDPPPVATAATTAGQ